MPSKLKLNLDQLTVDSFDTSAPKAEKGTVFGEQCTCYTNCTCPGCPTCDASCNGTCGGTCGDNTCAESCYGSCETCGGDTCDYYVCGYSWACDTYYPCPSPIYTICGNYVC